MTNRITKATGTFLLGLLLTTCTCRATQPVSQPMVVGSYNIWCGFSEEHPYPWSQRSRDLGALIRFCEYDLLGLQEVTPTQLEYFKTLTEYGTVGTGREEHGLGEQQTILYRLSRFELLDSATFWLSETPGQVSPGWDAMYNRVVTWARFSDKTNGQQFYFFNTHFDHIGAKAREESARLLTASIAEITDGNHFPVICTGDFNTQPETAPIRQMETLLQSARNLSKTPAYTTGTTFRGMEVCPENGQISGEIDYVFVSNGIEVHKYGALTLNNGTFYPSDHLPLLTVLTLPADTTIKQTDSKMTTGIIHTEKGDMKVEFYDAEAPGTVANFVKLARNNFYDGLSFHRVIPDFVIQGGCPLGTGAGGPGYSIPCETSGGRQYHDRGVLSMAHRGRDTGGSQFFICHSRNNTAHLDGLHTCFGRVTEGLEVIDQIRQGDLILGIDIFEQE